LKTAQKNEENRQLLEAVINYLGQNGVEAHLTVIYEGGKRSVVIVLPNVRADEVIGTPSGMAPLGDKTRPTTSLTSILSQGERKESGGEGEIPKEEAK
jgi:hypothetical protein